MQKRIPQEAEEEEEEEEWGGRGRRNYFELVIKKIFYRKTFTKEISYQSGQQ